MLTALCVLGYLVIGIIVSAWTMADLFPDDDDPFKGLAFLVIWPVVIILVVGAKLGDIPIRLARWCNNRSK